MRSVEDAIKTCSSDLTRSYSCKIYGASQNSRVETSPLDVGEFPHAQDMKYPPRDYRYLPARLIHTTQPSSLGFEVAFRSELNCWYW